MKPSLAIIMLGTNVVPGISNIADEAAMREIIAISLEMGVIPAISTIPPMHRTGMESRVATFNALLANLAFEYDIPLVDYCSALQSLPNQGTGRKQEPTEEAFPCFRCIEGYALFELPDEHNLD